MKNNINLLPSELGTGGDAYRINQLINRIGMIVGGGFLFFAFLLGLYVVFLITDLNSVQARVEILKEAISDKQKVEQEYIFVKDRINKLKPILASQSVIKNVELFEGFFVSVPQGVNLKGTEIAKDIVTASFDTTSSSDLVALFGILVEKSGFKEVKVKSLSFNPGVGYVIDFELKL